MLLSGKKSEALAERDEGGPLDVRRHGRGQERTERRNFNRGSLRYRFELLERRFRYVLHPHEVEEHPELSTLGYRSVVHPIVQNGFLDPEKSRPLFAGVEVGLVEQVSEC